MNKVTEQERLLLDQLKHAVVFFDEDGMNASVGSWLEEGFDPAVAIFSGLVPGMEEVGKLYEDQVYFIPELLLCADVLYRGLDLLRSWIETKDIHPRGRIVIGVVYGDIHDIGKNIVKMMLDISGFEVHDLGRDVSLEVIAVKLAEVGPDILCLSAMMTTTMFEMRRMIRFLKKDNPELKIMVGGAPFTEKIAWKWGANGYGRDAHHALKSAMGIMSQIKKEAEINF